MTFLFKLDILRLGEGQVSSFWLLSLRLGEGKLRLNEGLHLGEGNLSYYNVLYCTYGYLSYCVPVIHFY